MWHLDSDLIEVDLGELDSKKILEDEFEEVKEDIQKEYKQQYKLN